ncbi:MAG: beta-ketoacyl-ACP synthase II [Planctomycetaceae bacterium]|jgi:3-oxoacyl-[acyl-carrier-protein] synthase II|nr:beta-ketoacyl-ACP synthase II [Planctomycetaceae bacterium]
MPRTITLRRVVVTGLGAVTDVGLDVPTFWKSLLDGTSGIGPITSFPQTNDWSTRFGGEVRGFDPEKHMGVDGREAKRMDRFCLYGLGAAVEAARDCGIDFATGDFERRGVAIGSGIGGIDTIETNHTRLTEGGPRKVSPFVVPRLMVNACAGQASIRFNLQGVNIATATACATGSHAIGAAFHMIQRGDAEVMLAGGAEGAIGPVAVSAFSAMKALSTRNEEPTKASRPFDKDRDGFVLAEGAAVVVLEELEHARKRGARIYAEVMGYGCSGDAYHIAAPDDQGSGAFRSMRMALREAELNPDQIAYINAHGTSTPLGDKAEVVAVKRLFGDHAHKLAMSSTKSVTGHALGAAGGIESVATVLAIVNDTLPPTINLDNPDEGMDLNFVPHTPQKRKTDFAINNSFGFGGHNTSLIFGRFQG